MIYYLIGATIIMLAGIAGVVFPVLPGIPLMALVAVLFQIFTKALPTYVLVILGLITILSISIDYFSGVLGAKYSGANGKSTLIGVIGMFIGIGLIPPFGAIIGLFAGILVGELYFKKDTKKALKAASGGAISVVIGMILNLILALGFLTIFLIGAIRSL